MTRWQTLKMDNISSFRKLININLTRWQTLEMDNISSFRDKLSMEGYWNLKTEPEKDLGLNE